MERDPVCKANVDEKTAKFKTMYEGRVFYFCSEDCQEEFEYDPEEYVV